MEVVLEGNEVKEFIDKDIPKPLATDAQDMLEPRKSGAKVRRIIL